MNLLDKILSEWSYRIDTGIPDIENPLHLIILREVMRDYQFPEEVIVSTTQHLMERGDVIVKNKDLLTEKSKEKFYAKNTDTGKLIDFESEEARDAAVREKPNYETAEKGDEKPKQQANGDEKQIGRDDMLLPAEKHSKDSLEKTTNNVNKVGVKTKPIDQKIETTQIFNTEFAKDGVSDSTFETNEYTKPTNNQLDIKDEDFINYFGKPTKYPTKYNKVLKRLLNTKKSNKISISDFTDTSGAGTLASAGGELITMMLLTIEDDDKTQEFADKLITHIKANGKDSILDAGWIKSAVEVRRTTRKRFDRMYGKGNWKLENMAWDIESEVESLGLQDYKKNKGYSTDTYAKVNVNGTMVLDEISLKKELKANLLNTSTGKVSDIMVRGVSDDATIKRYDDIQSQIDALAGKNDTKSKNTRDALKKEQSEIEANAMRNVPENVQVSYAASKQAEIHREGIKKNSDNIKKFAKEWDSMSVEEQTEILREIRLEMGQTKISEEDFINTFMNEYGKFLTLVTTHQGELDLDTFGKFNKEVGLHKDKGGTLKYMQKTSMILSTLAGKLDNPYGQIAIDARENAYEHSKAVAHYLGENEEAKKGLFRSIGEQFPLKSLFSGEENMALGGVSADRQVLQDIFGVSSFAEVDENLMVRDTPPPSSIVYRVKGQEDIAVAEVKARPDGIGYNSVWKLEMVLHKDFQQRLVESNKKLDQENM